MVNWGRSYEVVHESITISIRNGGKDKKYNTTVIATKDVS